MTPMTTYSVFQSRQNAPAIVLSWTLFLLPAMGVPSESLLQDTLKSAIAAFGILMAALAYCWRRESNSPVLRWHGLLWLPLSLLTYALGSMVWGHTYLAAVEAVRWFLFFVLLLLCLNCIARENVTRLLWAIHAGASVASFWAALQFYFDLSWFPQFAAPASTFANRNFFAEYLVCTLPFSAWLFARSSKFSHLCLLTLTISLNVTALFMTGTRSALLALFCLAPCVWLTIYRFRFQLACSTWDRKTILIITLIAISGLGVLGNLPCGNSQLVEEGRGATPLGIWNLRTESLADLKEYREGSFAVRAFIWRSTMRMISDHPWLGVGAGGWEIFVPLYQGVNNSVEVDYYAHNEYLQLISEYGAPVGGLLISVMLAYLLHSAGRTWRLDGKLSAYGPQRGIAFCAMLGVAIVSGAGFPLRLAGTGVLMAVSLALIASSDIETEARGLFFGVSILFELQLRRFATFVFGAALALALIITIQAIRAESKFIQAIHLGNSARKSGDRSEASTAVIANLVRDAIDINPHYRKLASPAADGLALLGDLPHAADALEHIALSRPYVPDIWFDLALLYDSMHQSGKAQLALGRLSELQPSANRTKELHLLLLLHSGQKSEALETARKLIDDPLSDPDVVLFAKTKIREAGEVFISTNPEGVIQQKSAR